jgi:type VI secretion system protein
MVEARARAKAELGVMSTTIELDGNNPIKFIRAPDRVLEALLGPPQPGFMAAEAAIDDAFRDLQLHELATVAATRAAMEQTLARFSPAAIRARRRDQGVLARLLPQARAAALWRAYEDEFEGVVRGADEAFMDLFGKAFRTEYGRCLEAAAAKRR